MMQKTIQAAVGEFFGTFALVFFGAGAAITAATHGSAGGGLTAVALAHGFVLLVFVTATLHVSGAQFNPAVSIGLVVAGKQSVARAALCIGAQCVAAVCGAGLLVLLLGRDVADSAAANLGATLGALSTGEGADPAAVFGLEVVMTFTLMWVILRCVADERMTHLLGFAVGLTVAVCILFGGPFTGASMNPARSLGPALYGHWEMHWVYWAAPITGAVLAAVVDRAVFAAQRD